MVIKPASMSDETFNISSNGAQEEHIDKAKGKKIKQSAESNGEASGSSEEDHLENLSKKKRKLDKESSTQMHPSVSAPKVGVRSSGDNTPRKKERTEGADNIKLHSPDETQEKLKKTPDPSTSSLYAESPIVDESSQKKRKRGKTSLDAGEEEQNRSKSHEKTQMHKSKSALADSSQELLLVSARSSPSVASPSLQLSKHQQTGDVPLHSPLDAEPQAVTQSQQNSHLFSYPQDIRVDRDIPPVDMADFLPDAQEFQDFIYSGPDTPGYPPAPSVLYAEKISAKPWDFVGVHTDEKGKSGVRSGRSSSGRSTRPLSVISSESNLSEYMFNTTADLASYITGIKSTKSQSPSAHVSNSFLAQRLLALVGVSSRPDSEPELVTPKGSFETMRDPIETSRSDVKPPTPKSAAIYSNHQSSPSRSRQASPSRQTSALYASNIASEEVSNNDEWRVSPGTYVLTTVPFPFNRFPTGKQSRWSPPAQSSLKTLRDRPVSQGQPFPFNRLSAGSGKSENFDARPNSLFMNTSPDRKKPVSHVALTEPLGTTTHNLKAQSSAPAPQVKPALRLPDHPPISERLQRATVDQDNAGQPNYTHPYHWLVVNESDVSRSSMLSVWTSRSIDSFNSLLELMEYLLLRLLWVWFISTFISCLKQQVLQRYYYDSTNFHR